MAIAPAELTINPHVMLPGVLMQYAQRSGAFEMLLEGQPESRLDWDTQKIYTHTLHMQGTAFVGQHTANNFQSISFDSELIGTTPYKITTNAKYNRLDEMNASRLSLSYEDMLRAAAHQTVFHQTRVLLLYGGIGDNEGILNTPNAYETNLPADSGGNTTISTYNAGEFAQFLLKEIQRIRAKMYQLGQDGRITITSTQNIVGFLTTIGVIQLTDGQKEGAGSYTTGERIEYLLKRNKVDVEWCMDDTLAGKGAGGKDVMLITMPEIVKQKAGGINTNAFGELPGGILQNIAMYSASAAPVEFTAPMADASGAAYVKSWEYKVTPGWGLRGEAITILSADYE